MGSNLSHPTNGATSARRTLSPSHNALCSHVIVNLEKGGEHLEEAS